MKTLLRIMVAIAFVLGMGFAGAEGPWWGNIMGLLMIGWACLTMKYI